MLLGLGSTTCLTALLTVACFVVFSRLLLAPIPIPEHVTKKNRAVTLRFAGGMKDPTFSWDGDDDDDDDANQHLDKKEPNAEEKFLLYPSYAGYSNQLNALWKAVELAYTTNRTLVLPPVLPHKPDKSETVSGISASTSQDRRLIHRTPQDHLETVVEQLSESYRQSNSESDIYTSFMEIIDFSKLNERLNGSVRVIDSPDFVGRLLDGRGDGAAGSLEEVVRESLDVSTDFWREYDRMEKKFSQGLQYWKLVRDFRYEYDNKRQSTAAVVPWPFYWKKPKTYDPHTTQRFRVAFSSHPISPKLKRLIRSIFLDHLMVPSSSTGGGGDPSSYAGVHIRIADWSDGNCDDPSIRKANYNILQSLRNNPNVTASTLIFMGRSYKNAKTCFLESQGDLDEKYLNVVTVNDIVEGSPQLQEMVDGVDLEASTLYLLLDQFLLSMSNPFFRDISAYHKGESTFQDHIEGRRAYRDLVIEQLLSPEI